MTIGGRRFRDACVAVAMLTALAFGGTTQAAGGAYTGPPWSMDDADFTTSMGGFAIYDAVAKGEFAEANQWLDTALRTKQRQADGTWHVGALFRGYGLVLEHGKQWDDQIAQIRKWRAAEPRNANAALIESVYWIRYGWMARGTEFAGSVPGAAMSAFQDRIGRAETVLIEAKPYAAGHPVWYFEMLDVALVQGWPLQRRMAVFSEGQAVAPYYYPLYTAMGRTLSPRWGGDITDFNAFVNTAVAATPDDGKALAARLYWTLATIENNQDPFQQVKIPWPAMKAGFDDLVARTPRSQWNVQNYAHFACIADDKAAFVALLPKIDPQRAATLPPIWDAPYTFEYCVDAFAEASATSPRRKPAGPPDPKSKKK